MKKKLIIISVFILATMILSAIEGPVQAQDGVEALQLVFQDDILTWQTGWVDQELNLTIYDPDDQSESFTFTEGKAVTFHTGSLIDGRYNFRLIGVPAVDIQRLKSAAETEEGRDSILTRLSDEETHIWSGGFRIVNGVVYLPETENERDEDLNRTKDAVTDDDAIITGSLCVGTDCADGESFGFSTIKLKENNLRLSFEDTSMGTFPTNDWTIQINDTFSGGQVISRYGM